LRDNRVIAALAPVKNTHERNAALRNVVAVYHRHAVLNRTALKEPDDIWPLYPDAIALVMFPRCQPADIIAAARYGAYLPPGISRHIVHGRALRVNYPLDASGIQTPACCKNGRWQSGSNRSSPSARSATMLKLSTSSTSDYAANHRRALARPLSIPITSPTNWSSSPPLLLRLPPVSSRKSESRSALVADKDEVSLLIPSDGCETWWATVGPQGRSIQYRLITIDVELDLGLVGFLARQRVSARAGVPILPIAATATIFSSQQTRLRPLSQLWKASGRGPRNMGEFFFNQDDSKLQPRDRVRIEELTVTAYPDRFRLRIHIQVTPFRERPNLVLVAHDDNDRIVSELSIIETMHADMEFTMHIRNVEDPAGTYTLTADLFYETKNPPHDRRLVAFVVPEAVSQDES
jgi:hypothetical protein